MPSPRLQHSTGWFSIAAYLNEGEVNPGRRGGPYVQTSSQAPCRNPLPFLHDGLPGDIARQLHAPGDVGEDAVESLAKPKSGELCDYQTFFVDPLFFVFALPR